MAVALAVLTGVAFLPALDAEFLNWDDDVVVSENPNVQTLSWATVRWAVSTDLAGYAMPLTWLSHALDRRLYGLDARGHHATSVLLHVANTVLVFALFTALTGAVWRSAAVAALFGVHPLHVEAVAWIAERKEVLSAFFFLVTLLAYVRFVRMRTRALAVAVAAAFVAAVLSKPMAMTLPAVLLLLDYWPLGRLSWRAVREKLPLVAIAVAVAVWAFVGSAAAGAVKATAVIAVPERLANALVSYVRYLALTLWPLHLSPWYSHPALEGVPLSRTVVIASAAVLVAATVLAVRVAPRRPHVAVGWFWYLGTLFPVIGLVQVGGQAMADRYTYVPLIGIFVLVVWEVAALPLWSTRAARRAGTMAAAAVLVTLAGLTWRQTGVWHDRVTFWTTTLAANPRAAIAYYALAGLDARAGRNDAAMAKYRRALKLRPDFMNARRELAGLLVRAGRPAAAAVQYRKTIAAGGGAEDHNNLANVLMNQGHTAAARRHLQRALALRPEFAEAYNNLGIVFADEGKLHDAEAQFRAALRIRPDFVAARRNLGAVMAEMRAGGADAAP